MIIDKLFTPTSDQLPGGSEHAKEFLDTILSNNMDGVIYLQSILDSNGNPFDYILRYYNNQFLKVYNSVGKFHLQPGNLLFEIYPGLKKNLVFFRIEKLLKNSKNIEFTKYFDNDGLDHWLSIRITRYLDNGYIVNISNKTKEIKEKLWSEANLKASELLLKNHYWRLAITPIIKKIYEVSGSSRVNIYFTNELDSENATEFHLVDSWFDDCFDKEHEKFREVLVFPDSHIKDSQSPYYHLKSNKIYEWKKERNSSDSHIQKIMLSKSIVRSALVPIVLSNYLVGFIELENPKGNLLYSRERRILNNISESFSAAIIRRLTRKKVEESQIYYRTLVEKLDAVIFKTKINDPFHFVYINPNIYNIIGLDSISITKNIDLYSQLLHPDDLETITSIINQASINKKSYQVDYRMVLDEKRTIWIRESAIPIPDEFGHMEEYLGYITDITLQKKQEQDFLETKKLESIGRFTGGIAHDLNNMIQPGMIYLSIIKEALEGKDEFKKLIPKIDKAYTSLLRSKDLIKKILDFSRSKSPNQELTNLRNSLTTAIHIIERRENAIFSNIDIAAIPEDYSVPLDSDSLIQVFYNVFLNSMEAMVNQDYKTIHISSEIESNYFIIRIMDNGPGISESNLGYVFDPFFTTKEIGEGSGLGLSIVYGIMKNISGSIKIENYSTKSDSIPEVSGVRVELRFPQSFN